MTIVEKVIKLLTNYGQMSLFEIYDALPEHTEASIRGNINRKTAAITKVSIPHPVKATAIIMFM